MLLVFSVGASFSGYFVSRDSFPRLNQAHINLRGIENDMQTAKINGTQSDNAWIAIGDGYLSITGFVNRSSWREFVRTGQSQHNLFVPQKVSGFTMYHIIPFFESGETVKQFASSKDRNDSFDFAIEVSWQQDHSDHSELQALSDVQDYRLTRLNLSVQDGWLHADKIVEYRDVFYPYEGLSSLIDMGFYSSVGLSAGIEDLMSEGPYFLEITEGQRVEISGINSGGASRKNPMDSEAGQALLRTRYSAATHVLLPGRILDAPIFHSVRVHFLGIGVAERFIGEDYCIVSPGWEITLPVVLEYDKLFFRGE